MMEFDHKWELTKVANYNLDFTMVQISPVTLNSYIHLAFFLDLICLGADLQLFSLVEAEAEH